MFQEHLKNLWEDALQKAMLCIELLSLKGHIRSTYSKRTWDVIITGRQNYTENMNGGAQPSYISNLH